MNPAIPIIENPGEMRIAEFTDSPFVEIKPDERFETGYTYFEAGMKNAVKACLVRKEVYERLLKAHAFLPKGYRFYLFDTWRPFLLQEELYGFYSEKVIRQFHLENAEEEEKQKRITAFVSVPVKDPAFPPVHTTGGAVDLTVLDEKGRMLDMGAGFDEISEKSNTAYYETVRDTENYYTIRDNRRLLYHAMTGAGFTNLPSEWWHYDYGDRFWAYYTNQPAVYAGVFERGTM